MKRPLSPPLHETPRDPVYASTAQIARAVGVSVTTVKRWVDDGILPAHRTAGGHRKILLHDVLKRIREGGLPRADLASLLPTGKVGKADPAALAAAIGAIDAAAIRAIVIGAYRDGLPISQLADTLIAPALSHVGIEWEHGRLSIEKEHRVTQIFVAVLHDLDMQLRVHTDANSPVALGGAPEHDHFILPTLLASMALRDSGWAVGNLGPHTPFSAFRTAIERASPRLIWISVSHLADGERFADEYREFFRFAAERGIAVAIGGQGLTQELRSGLPYTTFGDGFVQLAAFAKMLYPRPALPKRGRPAGSGQKPK